MHLANSNQWHRRFEFGDEFELFLSESHVKSENFSVDKCFGNKTVRRVRVAKMSSFRIQ